MVEGAPLPAHILVLLAALGRRCGTAVAARLARGTVPLSLRQRLLSRALVARVLDALALRRAENDLESPRSAGLSALPVALPRRGTGSTGTWAHAKEPSQPSSALASVPVLLVPSRGPHPRTALRPILLSTP